MIQEFSVLAMGAEQKYISALSRHDDKKHRKTCVVRPIYDPNVKAQINHMLSVMLADNVKARVLDKVLGYTRKRAGGEKD